MEYYVFSFLTVLLLRLNSLSPCRPGLDLILDMHIPEQSGPRPACGVLTCEGIIDKDSSNYSTDRIIRDIHKDMTIDFV